MSINWDAPIEIRDGRNGNWFWVDKQVWQHPELTSSDKVVYGTLAYFANQKTQQAFPQMKTLETHCKLSRRQIYRSTRALEEFKFIHIKRQRGNPNIYTLVDNWKKLQGSDKLSLVTGSPTSSDSMSHGLVTNNTSNNNISTNKKKNNTLVLRTKGALPQFGNPDINLCLEELTKLLGNKPSKETLNRYAIKRLITKLGSVKRVIGAINYAFRVREEDRYAPRIYNFIDLEEKLEPLKGYGKQKAKSKSVNVEEGIAYLERKKSSVIIDET